MLYSCFMFERVTMAPYQRTLGGFLRVVSEVKGCGEQVHVLQPWQFRLLEKPMAPFEDPTVGGYTLENSTRSG